MVFLGSSEHTFSSSVHGLSGRFDISRPWKQTTKEIQKKKQNKEQPPRFGANGSGLRAHAHTHSGTRPSRKENARERNSYVSILHEEKPRIENREGKKKEKKTKTKTKKRSLKVKRLLASEWRSKNAVHVPAGKDWPERAQPGSRRMDAKGKESCRDKRNYGMGRGVSCLPEVFDHREIVNYKL